MISIRFVSQSKHTNDILMVEERNAKEGLYGGESRGEILSS